MEQTSLLSEDEIVKQSEELKRLERKRVNRNIKLKQQIPLHCMMLPSVILAMMFSIAPLFGIIIAFQKYSTVKGIFQSQFVDIYQFKTLFNRADFTQVLFNTVYIALWKIILTTFLSIVFALLLNEMASQKMKKLVQTIIFLPYFLSWALVGSVFVEMFSLSGVVNKLFGTSIDFLGSNNYFRGIIVGTDVWKNLGYQAVVFLAAITGIDLSLYEAANVDGANRWDMCWHITLPGIKTMIILTCVLNIGNIMNAGFEQILVMYNPLVYETGDILDTMSYRESFVTGTNFSMSTAISLFKSIISCVFFAISYRLAYKIDKYTIF